MVTLWRTCVGTPKLGRFVRSRGEHKGAIRTEVGRVDLAGRTIGPIRQRRRVTSDVASGEKRKA